MTWKSEVGEKTLEHQNRRSACDYAVCHTRTSQKRAVVVEYDDNDMPLTTIIVEAGVITKVAESSPLSLARSRLDAATSAHRHDPSPSTETELRRARFDYRILKNETV